jgi:N-acyl-D-aspartate/D-glutamate deacylase
MFDLVIKNGMILDGTGKDGFVCDIGILNGKIAKIDRELSGREVLNAEGLVVSPGWIDAHSHNDTKAMEWRDQKEKVEQGITMSIGGQCGSGATPAKNMSTAQYFEIMNAEPIGSGIAVLAGHGNIRRVVMGTQNADPTEEQLEKMKDVLRQCLKDGARGMSLGLYYVPGCMPRRKS